MEERMETKGALAGVKGALRGTELVPITADPPAALRPKQEAFSQAYVAHGNATRAYREAFDCDPTTKPATIRQRAYDLVHDPGVAARIRELYAAAAVDTVVDARSRMVRLQEIVEADPGELVRVVAEPCRHCYGDGHAYQWIDPAEHAAACVAATRDGQPWPDCDGGFGFDPTRDPAPDCIRCRGEGVTRVAITPTDKLSPSARRLLKSIRQKASGEIEVRLHDPLVASDQLNRMQAVYLDRSVSINANVNVPVPEAVSAADALAFLKTLTPS
ncbi:MAG TPA: terminase small subunit [Steroidobacteraceae bacterium]|jgi:hypothetical protein